MSDANPHADASPADAASRDGPAAATSRDKLLLVLFWVWAAILLTATLAQLFGWEGLLDAMDVKRWFAK
ncbi:MAG: hypothetical protein K8T90_10220 [Planctomycetes bacterium]|nr:hypothetical protein [Planctomycetota bacterium]